MDGRCWLYSSFFVASRMHGRERKKKRGKSDRAERDALIGWRRVMSMMSAKWAAVALRCTSVHLLLHSCRGRAVAWKEVKRSRLLLLFVWLCKRCAHLRMSMCAGLHKWGA